MERVRLSSSQPPRRKKPFRYRGRAQEREDTNVQKVMVGIALVRNALTEFDRAREALEYAADTLISDINDPRIPEVVRTQYKRFYAQGGCNAGQWMDWVNGTFPNKERVPVKGGLRLVISNKSRRVIRLEPDEAA